jgi:hypothetical protein
MSLMFSTFVACFFGLWLLSSAWSKLRDPQAFGEIVRSYPLPRWVNPGALARGIPLLEVLLGLTLLSLDPRLAGPALIGTLGFLGMTTAAVISRLARGEKRFRCGCGGDLGEVHSGSVILLRNTLLIGLGIIGLASADGLSPSNAALPIYLTGGGLVLGLKLAAALLRAWRYRTEWKVSG